MAIKLKNGEMVLLREAKVDDTPFAVLLTNRNSIDLDINIFDNSKNRWFSRKRLSSHIPTLIFNVKVEPGLNYSMKVDANDIVADIVELPIEINPTTNKIKYSEEIDIEIKTGIITEPIVLNIIPRDDSLMVVPDKLILTSNKTNAFKVISTKEVFGTSNVDLKFLDSEGKYPNNFSTLIFDHQKLEPSGGGGEGGETVNINLKNVYNAAKNNS